MLYALSFLLVLSYFYGRPSESKLGSCYTLVWLEISLLISPLLLYIKNLLDEAQSNIQFIASRQGNIKADFLSLQKLLATIFFKRNQSSDTCSHGFGAKFLL